MTKPTDKTKKSSTVTTAKPVDTAVQAAQYVKKFRFNASGKTSTITPLVVVSEIPPVPQAPEVYYTMEVYKSISYLVQECKKEVGWLGLVDKLPDGSYLITEIFVPKQVVTAAETDITVEAISELTVQLIMEGKDPEKLRYWGHSHVNMDVAPSGQDETQMDMFMVNNPWFIRGIYNKKNEAKVDVFDKEKGVIFLCVEDTVQDLLISDELCAKLDALIDENVVEYTYPVAVNTWQNGGFANRMSTPGKALTPQGQNFGAMTTSTKQAVLCPTPLPSDPVMNPNNLTLWDLEFLDGQAIDPNMLVQYLISVEQWKWIMAGHNDFDRSVCLELALDKNSKLYKLKY